MPKLPPKFQKFSKLVSAALSGKKNVEPKQSAEIKSDTIQRESTSDPTGPSALHVHIVPELDPREEEYLSDFFLTKKEYPSLYEEADRLSMLTAAQKIAQGIDSKKQFHAPVEQLSPLGLSVISHLYAEKDNNQKQPIIAGSMDSLTRFIQLIDSSTEDIEVTVIFQPMNLLTPEIGADDQDKQWLALDNLQKKRWLDNFSPLHKTVLKIRKTNSNFQLASLDGSNIDEYGDLTISLVLAALSEKHTVNRDAPQPGKTHIHVSGAYQIHPPKSDFEMYSRLVDQYRCGVFALTDAKKINRDPAFIDKAMDKKYKIDDTVYRYPIPAQYLTSAQGSALRNAMAAHQDEIVTRANPSSKDPRKQVSRTLGQTWAHHKGDYIRHFSQKYHDLVEKFAKANINNLTFIKKISDRYNAKTITLDELEDRYRLNPEPELKNHTERLTGIEKHYTNSISPHEENNTEPVTMQLPPVLHKPLPASQDQITEKTSKPKNT